MGGKDAALKRKTRFHAGAENANDYTTGSSAPGPPERTLEIAIGAQVRLFRRTHDLSISDLASAANISTGMLSKIENGQISPSLSTLQAIAAALGVSITHLFAAFEDRRDCSFVRAKQGVIIERRGTKVGHVYQLLGQALGGDIVVEPFLITLKKDAVPYTAFRHAGVEFIYMLTGEVVYRHGERTYHLRPGDALLFDSGAMHGPEALIERPMTYLSIIIYPRLS
jgi:transcriptional regulator with XRE-family HTH domain